MIVSTAQCQVTVGLVVLYCNCFYRAMMVDIFVIVVVATVFINVVAVVFFGVGRPPNGPLSLCHPPNGENEWVGV